MIIIKNNEIVRSVTGKVYQAMFDVEESVYEIVPLEVTIRNLKIRSNFRIMDCEKKKKKKKKIYDIIITFKTQYDHRLLVDTMDKYLSVKKKKKMKIMY